MKAQPWVAVEAGTDRARLARELAVRRERILDGRGSTALLRPALRRSWARCAAAGVDPEHGAAVPAVDPDAAADLWAGHPVAGVLPAVRAVLSDASAEAGQVALFCAADGTLLWLDAAPALAGAAAAAGLVRGSHWSEATAGTNAMGTALVDRHPVQVFASEHFSRAYADWACSAAPVRDPDSGAILGVVDLSGPVVAAHPHVLTVAVSAARVAELELRRARDRDAAALVARHGSRLGRATVALAAPSGVVVQALRPTLVGRCLLIAPEGGAVALPGGGALVAEPLAGGGFALHAVRGRPETPIRVQLLGRERAVVDAGGGTIELGPRQTELLALLLVRPEGWSAEALALEVLGDFGKPVTVRVALSRLRQALGPAMASQPYRLVEPVDADLLEVSRHLAAGAIADALRVYAGELLPHSEAPAIVEARRVLDEALRAAVLQAGDPALLERWLRTPSGRWDSEAARLLRDRAPRGSMARSLADTRLRGLVQSFD